MDGRRIPWTRRDVLRAVTGTAAATTLAGCGLTGGSDDDKQPATGEVKGDVSFLTLSLRRERASANAARAGRT